MTYSQGAAPAAMRNRCRSSARIYSSRRLRRDARSASLVTKRGIRGHDGRLGQAPLEAGCYPAVEDGEVQALRAAKNLARSRWRRTQVELFTAARRAARLGDEDVAYEAHDEHLTALHDWNAAEASYIAARLGFPHEPLPPRKP